MMFNKTNIKTPLDERNEAFMQASGQATDEYLEQNQSDPMAFMNVLKGSITPPQDVQIPFTSQDRSPASLPDDYNQLAQEEAASQPEVNLPPTPPRGGSNYDRILKELRAIRSGAEGDIQAARQSDSKNELFDSLSKSAQGIGDAFANRAGITNIKSNPISLKSNSAEKAESDRKRKLEDLMSEFKMIAGKDQADATRQHREAMLNIQKAKDERADEYLEAKRKTEDRLTTNAEANMIRGVLKDDPAYKKVAEQSKEFSEINDLMGGIEQGNEAALAALGTKLARAMGEVGVLTDTDVTRYVGSTSWGRKLKDWYSKGAKGELPRDTLNEIKSNISGIQQSLSKSEKNVFDRAASRVKTIYPNKPMDDIYGILGYNPNSTNGTNGNTQLSDKDKKALEWAKQNPTDERSKQILQKLGM